MRPKTTRNKNMYRTIWRWHFYAGLLCIPFVIWLSATGMIYLFKPQIDAIIDSPYDKLIINQPASAYSQIMAALAAAPGSMLNAYELPKTPNAAVRILVSTRDGISRVYIHPETLEILKVIPEQDRFMRIISQLHGELMMGDKGSMLVELVASWVVVMLISGLYLWWPREAGTFGGILYPRLGSTKRIFWRDIHAVVGIWVSFFALFLILSGLPWTKSWGGMLKQIRQIGVTAPVKQDWTTSHAEHMGHNSGNLVTNIAIDYSPIDKLILTVSPLKLAPPVLISPPKDSTKEWTARSDSQNRPLRSKLTLDANNFEVIKRKDFADNLLIDRAIGIGVAAHEGQLFGWPNQLLGLLTALGLILMCISSLIMWWRRKPESTLGAPKAIGKATFAPTIVILIILLGIFLPMLGASIIIVTLCERFIMVNIRPLRDFLGLKK